VSGFVAHHFSSLFQPVGSLGSGAFPGYSDGGLPNFCRKTFAKCELLLKPTDSAITAIGKARDNSPHAPSRRLCRIYSCVDNPVIVLSLRFSCIRLNPTLDAAKAVVKPGSD